MTYRDLAVLITAAFLSVGFLWGTSSAAHATEASPELTFDLANSFSVAHSQPPQALDETSAPLTDRPLLIPTTAIAIPLGRVDTPTPLPPPPEIPNASTVAIANPPIDEVAPSPPASLAPAKHAFVSSDGTLNFELNQSGGSAELMTAQLPSPQLSPPEPTPEPPIALPPELVPLFHGDSDSLVARAVGSAEGTRTPNGSKTLAFQGHVDPGNGVWNLGTFSYQHGAASPEEADRKQLRRLKIQAMQLVQAANERGLTLSLEETLNAIDLANQSPRAALTQGGYIDRLAEGYGMGLRGLEAIAWARTRSFLDPDTSRWNAPGLGNTVERITRDQERRMRAIQATLSQHAIAQPTSRAPQKSDPAPSQTSLMDRMLPRQSKPSSSIVESWIDF